jgi:creatinine amidohydrolase
VGDGLDSCAYRSDKPSTVGMPLPSAPGGRMTASGMTGAREVRWERMFPDELEAEFARHPLVFFAYGLCEPHGPQNALGLDSLKAHALVCEAARAAGGIVAPSSYWHVHELASAGAWGHEEIGQVPRTWLTAIPPWHYLKSVLYDIRTADSHGFHGAILFTGHSSCSPEDLGLLVELVQPHVGTRLLGCVQSAGGFPIDHGGKAETQLLWAAHPECVDVSRIPPSGFPEPRWAMGGDAREADLRAGQNLLVAEASWLAERGRDLLGRYDHERPEHRLVTFGDVERLWTEVLVPALPRFRTMQDAWWDPAPPPPPKDSVWYAGSLYFEGIEGRPR